MSYDINNLKEITEPQVFNPPKKMLVIDQGDDEPIEKYVVAIINANTNYKVIVQGKTLSSYDAYQRCFELPHRIATFYEISRWLAKGNGQVFQKDFMDTALRFPASWSSMKPEGDIKVRKWGDTNWEDPTAQYLGLEE